MRLPFCLLALLLWCGAVFAGSGPQRVVSLNLCADQLLIDLLEPDRIAALTALSVDPDLSFHYETARTLPRHNGQFETIIALKPDLIFAGRYTTTSTTQLLRSLGYPVVTLDVPTSIESLYEQIRMVGIQLQMEAKTEQLIASIQHELSLYRVERVPDQPVAAAYFANGMSMGRESVINDLLNWTGFDNLTALRGVDHFSHLPLEELLSAHPDVVVLGNQNPDRRSMAQQILSHRALRQYAALDTHPAQRIAIPDRYWLCAGPSIVHAAKQLYAARQALNHVH